MRLRQRTRTYSIAMGAVNLGVALFLGLLSRINEMTGAQSMIVSVTGPILTVAFAVVTIGWFVDALRPGELGDVLPGIRPRNDDEEHADDAGDPDKRPDRALGWFAHGRDRRA